jgi:hypothetical protein
MCGRDCSTRRTLPCDFFYGELCYTDIAVRDYIYIYTSRCISRIQLLRRGRITGKKLLKRVEFDHRVQGPYHTNTYSIRIYASNHTSSCLPASHSFHHETRYSSFKHVWTTNCSFRAGSFVRQEDKILYCTVLVGSMIAAFKFTSAACRDCFIPS